VTARRIALLVLLLPACTAASHERYLTRIGLLAGEKEQLDHYEAALTSARLDDLLALFDRDPSAQRSGAQTVLDLRTKLAPLLEPGAAIDCVESEVREFDLFGRPPTATFWFHVAGHDGHGARHSLRVASFTTFHELSRAPVDENGMPVAKLALAAQEPFTVTHESAQRPHYEDATAKAGLSDHHRNQSIDRKCLILQGTMPGSGACAADFDQDGKLDLVAIDGQHSLFYRNRGDGTFEDQSKQWGLDRVTGAGCLSADYDDDGDEDLYVLDHFGGTKLLRNETIAAGGAGSKTFVDVTSEAGVGVPDPTFSATFFDMDRDGDLDLYVPCAGDYYSQVPMPPFMARDGKPDRLFVNDGHGHFTEEAKTRGVDDVGWGLASGACDFDADGDDDLYMANDFGCNSLFVNDGTGHFKDVASQLGAADRGYGMGVSWGDVDGDGDFDLYVSDIYSEYAPVFLDPDYPLPLIGRVFRGWVGRELNHMGLGNALLLNEPDGKGGRKFVDVAKDWHVNECGWAWGGMFLDYDDDGDLDVYCTDGSYAGPSPEELELTFWSLSSLMWEKSKMQQWLFDAQGRSLQGHERKRLFEQRGPGQFAEVAALHDVNGVEAGRGLVLGDFDDDGSVDLYLRNLNAEARYYHNTGGPNHWVRLKLEGTKSNRGAVGAVVKVTAAGRTQLRQVTAGEGFYSSHDKRVLVGLAGETKADVEVRWPSGLVQRFDALAADRQYHLVEGKESPQP
jgi:hypothetical protein